MLRRPGQQTAGSVIKARSLVHAQVLPVVGRVVSCHCAVLIADRHWQEDVSSSEAYIRDHSPAPSPSGSHVMDLPRQPSGEHYGSQLRESQERPARSTGDDGDSSGSDREEEKGSRRSSKRHSRHRDDKDKDRDRKDREKDRERDKDRDRDRERDKDKDRSRERDRERERDKDRERRKRDTDAERKDEKKDPTKERVIEDSPKKYVPLRVGVGTRRKGADVIVVVDGRRGSVVLGRESPTPPRSGSSARRSDSPKVQRRATSTSTALPSFAEPDTHHATPWMGTVRGISNGVAARVRGGQLVCPRCSAMASILGRGG